MKYILFTLLFIYLTNWQAIIALAKGAFFSKRKSLPYKNEWLTNLLKNKTGIEFKLKKAVLDKYGGYSLIYPPNTIVLTSKVWDDFNKDELQWIALHEAGHRVYRHGYKYIPVSLIFVILGIFVLRHHSNPVVNFVTVALILDPLYQQVIRIFETQADRYALMKMDNPQGMITANEKFAKATKSRIYKSNVLRTLFTPHLSYSQRIEMAEKEMENRKENPWG